MARKSRMGVLKRQRELKKAEKAAMKRERRKLKKEEAAAAETDTATEDDLAGYGIGADEPPEAEPKAEAEE